VYDGSSSQLTSDKSVVEENRGHGSGGMASGL
jgi:hypothetical protein